MGRSYQGQMVDSLGSKPLAVGGRPWVAVIRYWWQSVQCVWSRPWVGINRYWWYEQSVQGVDHGQESGGTDGSLSREQTIGVGVIRYWWQSVYGADHGQELTGTGGSLSREQTIGVGVSRYWWQSVQGVDYMGTGSSYQGRMVVNQSFY